MRRGLPPPESMSPKEKDSYWSSSPQVRWKLRNPEVARRVDRENHRRYWSENREKYLRGARIVRASMSRRERERRRNYLLGWRRRHPGIQSKYQKKWNALHPEAVRRIAKKTYRTTRRNPRLWMAKKIRNYFNESMALRRSGGVVRVRGVFTRLGYSPAEAFNRLSRFVGKACVLCRAVRITWGNSHIDHRIPLASATTTVEVLGLWELKNLRLLCASCNLRKGSKIEGSP